MSLFRTLPWGVVVVVAGMLLVKDVKGGGLSPEEEHRLVMKADASVIDEKLKEVPYGVMMAPAPIDEHSLPVPTMDPPLPESLGKQTVQITTAGGLSGLNNKQALSERIRNAMKTMKERMRTLQTSRSRLPPKKPIEPVKVPKFPRPSSLISSNPSDLEVAMKRIEIMASRAGFNMSSLPRRSQLQIVSRLAPKLPQKMSSAVHEEMESMSGKLYQYLPEPARDPLIEDDQAFLQHFMDQFDHPHTQNDEFYKEVNSHVNSPSHQKLNSFDVSQVSLTDDPSHEPIQISESVASSSGAYLESSSPNIHLMPPKFDAGEGESSSSSIHTYSLVDDEGVPKPSALISQYPNHHADESDPLITLSSEVHSKNSAISPTNPSRTTKSFKVGSVKAYGNSLNTTPTPRAPPTIPTVAPLSLEDMGPTVSVPPKPIRVSVITKDSILVNDTSDDGSGSVRTIKYVHVEPLSHSTQSSPELINSFDKYLPLESVSKEVRINPKEITVNIDKNSLPRPRPSQLILDTYEVPSKEPEVEPSPIPSSAEPSTEDPYPLTDEEIAATVAELKKYEAEIAGLRQGENSLEVDYPYRLLTPHPLEYPDHPDHPQPSSLEDDSDLVSHLDELLAEFSAKPTEGTKTVNSAPVQLQATVHPSPGSPIGPLVMGPGIRRPHPLLKHRPPLRPGLGRPLMMGSRLRPMIRHPPAGFPRPAGNLLGQQQQPQGGNPPRINEVTVSQLPQKFNKECDYFSDELCLLVQDYPIEAITEAMEQNPSVSNALLSKEPLHNQKSSSYIEGIPESSLEANEGAELGSKHPDFAGEGGFLCPSKVAYGKIKKAKSSTTGDWKYVVNYGDKTQTLRLEKCLQPGDACSYIMPHFRTACTQVYNYHRLLAWDSEKGLHTDVFKVPTCCTCHVLGYYVPGSKKNLPQSPAIPTMRRRDHLPRFMGAPRPRRINHLPPPLPRKPHHHPQHPMMMMLPSHNHNNLMMSPIVSPLNAVPPKSAALTASSTPAATNSSATNSEDDVLRGLLLQYASLREKITKLKDSKGSSAISGSSSSSSAASSLQAKRSSKLYSHWPKDIIKALRKRKRQSTISSKNHKMKKPSPEMLKKLKNLLTNSTKLENNPKLKQKIKSYLKRLKNSSTRESKSVKSSSSKGRGGRNMKLKLTSAATTSSKTHKTKKGMSKADSKKRLLLLLTAAKKKLQDERQARTTSISSKTSPNRLTSSPLQRQPATRQLGIPQAPHHHHQNYESHPIWNYFQKLQAGSSSAARARRLRRLF